MAQISKKFWEDKRVLVTGNTGFKGSWLTIWLDQMKANVSGLALKPQTKPSLFEACNLRDRINHFDTDVRDLDELRRIFHEVKPEIIFHLAAQPLVRESYKDPISTVTTNIIGTINLYEIVREFSSVNTVVSVTTDKCYENKEWHWGYREIEPLGGNDPYSASKACVEILSHSYRESFFKRNNVALATARAGNVIGGGDWSEDRLIPDVLKELEASQVIKLRNPNSVRPWQHVLESISGYLALAEKLHGSGDEFSEAWNFGPCENDAKSVKELVRLIFDEWGGKCSWEIQQGEHPHEANFLKLDISKSKNRLNWQPRWNLETSVFHLVNWHKKFLSGDDPYRMCKEQIEEYMK